VVHWHLEPQLELSPGQKVLAKTVHGQEVGTVLSVLPDGQEPKETSEPFVREIVRLLNDQDRDMMREICQKDREAFTRARDLVAQHKLEMKLLKAEYFFDQTRLILYYKSDIKVDFRDLLKSLATTFRTRIELRQIGVRDETKLLGGLGCCGKEVCCAQFMTQFCQVSTKMAKDQNLSLNPVKLSGICGRLLCCLNHEYEYYASFHGKFPKIGAEIVVGAEKGRVMDLNYITRTLLIGYYDRRKVSVSLDCVKGRKDPATGRNMWWVQEEGQPEPDLGILFQQLVPPVARPRGKDRPRDGKPGASERSEREPQAGEQPSASDSQPPAGPELTDDSVPAESIDELAAIDGAQPALKAPDQPRERAQNREAGNSRRDQERPRNDRGRRPERPRREGQETRSGQGNRWNRQGGQQGPTPDPKAPSAPSVPSTPQEPSQKPVGQPGPDDADTKKDKV